MPIKKDEEISGCITQVPTVKGNLIVGKIKVGNEALPLVAFNNLDAKIKQKLFNLQSNQTVVVLGRFDPESKMGNRVIVNNVFDAEAIPSDISPKIQVEDKLPPKNIFTKKSTLRENMAKNFYPGPLFENDPYAIDPAVDFIESDLIKICTTVGGNVIYTDSRLWWVKDHETMRNKMILPPKLRELYLAQHNLSALYSTSVLWDEEELEKEPLPQGCPAEF
jgi:hypothetical protein